MPRSFRPLASATVISLLMSLGPAQVAVAAGEPATAAFAGSEAFAGSGTFAAPEAFGAPGSATWVWPVEGDFRVAGRFVAPAHDYAPGHRGIDLQPLEGATARSPADGIVAFSGQVAGRGILTIDHGGGVVTTLEPVDSVLAEGTAVARADVVGTVSLGGHAAAGTIHFGVRLEGRYINPMLLLGGVPRAVLVPCCDPL